MSEIPDDIRAIVRDAMASYGNAQSDGLGRQWDTYTAMNFAEHAVALDRSRRSPAPDAGTCAHCHGRGYVAGDPEGAPMEGCDFCAGTGRVLPQGAGHRKGCAN